jgi:hypothetical protein
VNAKRIDVFETLSAVQAYMDDAAFFPEHFKPGTVRGHQRDYKRLQDGIEELLSASRAFDTDRSSINEARWQRAMGKFA